MAGFVIGSDGGEKLYKHELTISTANGSTGFIVYTASSDPITISDYQTKLADILATAPVNEGTASVTLQGEAVSVTTQGSPVTAYSGTLYAVGTGIGAVLNPSSSGTYLLGASPIALYNGGSSSVYYNAGKVVNLISKAFLGGASKGVVSYSDYNPSVTSVSDTVTEATSDD
jgi:hypothetical protein